MKLTKCPHCGGKLRCETMGWICYKCEGFIDMQGVFHEHIEKPFAPPMTNADRIRELETENKRLHQQLETMRQDRDYYRDAYHYLLREKG